MNNTRVRNIFLAEPADSEPVPTRCLDGFFEGSVQEGGSIRVQFTRPLTFARDTDGSWLIYSWQNGRERQAESLRITDPTACDAMDALFELTACPDDFEGCIVGESDTDDEQ